MQTISSTIAAMPAGDDRTISRRPELKGFPMAPAEAIDERDQQIEAADFSREEQDGAQKVQAFAERMLGLFNDAALTLMVSIGHRTGLFDVLADLDPSTSGEIAAATGLN